MNATKNSMQLIDDYTHLISKCQLGAGNRQCQHLYHSTSSKVFACVKNSFCTEKFSKQNDEAGGDNCKGFNVKVENQRALYNI